MPKNKSPSLTREETINLIVQHLGSTQTKDERFNNGFAHFSLARPSSYIRAMEERLARFVSVNNVKVLEATVLDKTNKEAIKAAAELVGKTIQVERPLFSNEKPLTKWVENFYQESPSIAGLAREQQTELGKAAMGVAAISGFQPWGEEEEGVEPD